jgi:hypothetical protein
MTNFLNRMAARAVGSGAVSQPVVPALFTPGFGLAPNAAPAEAGPVSQEVEVTAVPAKTTTVPENATENTLPRGWQPFAPTGATDASGQPPAKSAAAHDATSVMVQSFFWKPAIVSIPTAEPALSVPGVSMPPQDNGANAYLSDYVVTSLRDSGGNLNDGYRPAGTGPAIASQVVPARPPSAEPLRPLPALPAHDRSVSRREAASSTASEPQIIRVTIGRIDVRAQFTTASSPAPARHGRTSALTVDEYLRQRREGKR